MNQTLITSSIFKNPKSLDNQISTFYLCIERTQGTFSHMLFFIQADKTSVENLFLSVSRKDIDYILSDVLKDWDNISQSTDNQLSIKQLDCFVGEKSTQSTILNNPYYISVQLKSKDSQIFTEKDLTNLRDHIADRLVKNPYFNIYFNKYRIVSVKLFTNTSYKKKKKNIITRIDSNN